VSDGVQPGVKIEPDIWERFREDVQARKGAVRGHLKTEVENALLEYIRDDASPTEQRIDDRLARIEEAVGAASADGGVDTDYGEPHTHAPERRERVTEKPSANAATDRKVAYLRECVIEEEVPSSRELDSIPRERLREVVKDEYGFRRDTARRYVRELVDAFDLRDHPNPEADGILVSEAHEQQLIDERRELARENINDDVYDSE